MSILQAPDADPYSGGPSFRLSNRIYRASWALTWALLASWTPPPLHGWRRFLLRLFGAKVACSAHIYGSARIWSPANFEIGESACVGPRATVYSMARIIMAPYSLLSQGAHLCAGTHDLSDPHFQLKARPIRLGPRAWVAAEAFVGPGVTMAEGAVLGARGCAMRDLDAWTVYTGNPAAKVRERTMKPLPGSDPDSD